MGTRDYGLCDKTICETLTPGSTREERMHAVVDLLWVHFGDQGIAWLGFYEITDGGDAMVLKVCRPKPACSPIGLHGVCGRAWREKRSQVVDDVHALGAAHIVCDPSNLSEVVVPCLDAGMECWGVLDLDSRELSSFTLSDAEGLRRVLIGAGLSL